MNEVRKKQKLFKKIMKVIVVITAVLMLVFIGIAPAITSVAAVTALSYTCDAMVILSLVLVLFYYSRYSKLELFLNDVEGEIEDCGYYLTAREERDISDYYDAVVRDLQNNGFRYEKDLELSELEFDGRALKTKEFFYLLCIDELDKNDIIAYLDAAVYDVTVGNLRRKGNCVVAFFCISVDDDALSLSKAVTAMGRKNQLKFTVAIIDVSQGKVYFSGLNPTKCQQMTASYIMNCSVPIDDKYKGNEKLKFQCELEEKMKSFTINDFKNGTFNIH